MSIYTHGHFDRYFKGPKILKTNITLAGRRMNINAQASHAAFAF